MRRLLVRLLAAVLVCEGVVLSLVAAAIFTNSLVPIIGPPRTAPRGGWMPRKGPGLCCGSSSFGLEHTRCGPAGTEPSGSGVGCCTRSSAGISSCRLRCPCGWVA
jgi:hypothetical protein